MAHFAQTSPAASQPALSWDDSVAAQVPRCYDGGANFGRLDRDQCQFSGAQVVVIPLPYDSTCSARGGMREGPARILQASWWIDFYHSHLRFDPADVGIATLDDVHPHMAGPQQHIERIAQTCWNALQFNKFLVTLGGEHTVTVGVCAALVRKFGPFSILQIDAHLDLRDQWEDTPWNHACVMRRMAELVTAAGGDGPRSLVQVGIRNVSSDEQAYLDERGLQPFFARDLHATSQQVWIEQILERLGPRVFVTVDLDGFDPSVIPAVGTPEPGGLYWQQVVAVLEQVFRRRQVIALDVNELCPIAGQNVSEVATARLIAECLAYQFAPPAAWKRWRG
ncbi:MAG: agmatinase [Myxococcales bacterium]|nr:agmatinase [Myxococcales bacterium]